MGPARPVPWARGPRALGEPASRAPACWSRGAPATGRGASPAAALRAAPAVSDATADSGFVTAPASPRPTPAAALASVGDTDTARMGSTTMPESPAQIDEPTSQTAEPIVCRERAGTRAASASPPSATGSLLSDLGLDSPDVSTGTPEPALASAAGASRLPSGSCKSGWRSSATCAAALASAAALCARRGSLPGASAPRWPRPSEHTVSHAAARMTTASPFKLHHASGGKATTASWPGPRDEVDTDRACLLSGRSSDSQS
mmetsp:Transcript_1335/g.5303  ORF Transcript_1335/g.5303 Transcript_1335/m.5303 type:complete len:260 (-) Transcript_1335:2843-3622(-)